MATTRRRLVRQDLRQCIERACSDLGRAITAWNRVTTKARRSKLTMLREARGWNQVELAQRSGVAQSTISRIERGSGVLLGTANALARALGCPVEELTRNGAVVCA